MISGPKKTTVVTLPTGRDNTVTKCPSLRHEKQVAIRDSRGFAGKEPETTGGDRDADIDYHAPRKGTTFRSTA